MVWLYIIILWEGYYPQPPVPFQTMQQCQQAAAEIRRNVAAVRVANFEASTFIYCSLSNRSN